MRPKKERLMIQFTRSHRDGTKEIVLDMER